MDLPPMPLESVWTWHAHTDSKTDYGNAVIKLGSFGTVQDFWRYYNNIPTPDGIFFGTHVLSLPKVFDTGCTVSGFAVFRNDVQPAWEDERNANGCDLCARPTFAPEQLATHWRDMLLALINEEFGENVVGVRLTYKRDRRTSEIIHKVEIWFEDLNTESARAVLAGLMPDVHFETVFHRDVVHVQHARHSGRHSRSKRGSS